MLVAVVVLRVVVLARVDARLHRQLLRSDKIFISRLGRKPARRPAGLFPLREKPHISFFSHPQKIGKKTHRLAGRDIQERDRKAERVPQGAAEQVGGVAASGRSEAQDRTVFIFRVQVHDEKNDGSV